jgi:hypothetical protein
MGGCAEKAAYKHTSGNFKETDEYYLSKIIELEKREQIISQKESEFEEIIMRRIINTCSNIKNLDKSICELEKRETTLKNKIEKSELNVRTLLNDIENLNYSISKHSSNNMSSNNNSNEEEEEGIKKLQEMVTQLKVTTDEKSKINEEISDFNKELHELFDIKNHLRAWLNKSDSSINITQNPVQIINYWLDNSKEIVIRSSKHFTNIRANKNNTADLTTNSLDWERFIPIKLGEENSFYFKSFHGTYLSSDENGKVCYVEKAGEQEKWIYDTIEGYLISFYFSTYLCGFPGDRGILETKLLNPGSSSKWNFYPSHTKF